MKIKTSVNINLIKPLECIDKKRNIWRLRWDIQDGSFEQIQLNHKPDLPEIKNIITEWYNKEVENRIIYGFKWKGMKVCLTKENQSNYMMFADTGLFPIELKFGSWEDPVFYTIKTASELAEFKKAMSEHIKQCLQLGWTKKKNIDWSIYEIAE